MPRTPRSSGRANGFSPETETLVVSDGSVSNSQNTMAGRCRVSNSGRVKPCFDDDLLDSLVTVSGQFKARLYHLSRLDIRIHMIAFHFRHLKYPWSR